jgi:multiple sugar transport system substrate-binding protein
VLPDEYKNNMEFFRTGKVGMIIGGAWDIQDLRTMPFRWNIAALPRQKRRATMVGSENYAISASTAHREKAWELLKFLLSPDSQRFMAEKLDKQPSLRSVAAEYAASPAGYDRRVLVDAVDYGIVPPNPGRWPEVSHFLQDQLDLVWVGKLSAEEAMKIACLEVNDALR